MLYSNLSFYISRLALRFYSDFPLRVCPCLLHTELFTSPGLKGPQQKQQREGIGGMGGMVGEARISPASRAGGGASGRGQWHTPPPSDGWRMHHPDGGLNGEEESSPRRRGEIRISGKGAHGTFKRQGSN